MDSTAHRTRPAAGEKLTKRDVIVQELRRMIAEGELPRGSHVAQDALARHFETSITPVREAMRQLEAEGLLVARPHRGVHVANADLEEVKGVYILRRLAEPYAMRRAARRMTLRDLDAAQSLIDDMEKATSRGNHLELTVANREFHFLFYRKAGVPALLAHIETLWQQYPWDLMEVTEDRPSLSIDEHRAQLEAIRRGDVEQAARTTEHHLWSGFAYLGQRLRGDAVPDPFDLDSD